MTPGAIHGGIVLNSKYFNKDRQNRTFMSNIYEKDNNKQNTDVLLPRTPDSVGKLKKFQKKNLIQNFSR